MGTGGFAVPIFQSLNASVHEIAALVTRPPRPVRGRRRASSKNPMLEIAEDENLPVHMPESINSSEAQDCLRQLDMELFVVCDYGQILTAKTLQLAKLGGINLHASLLPKYRGAAPINWAIYHGEVETGVTVIHMTPKLDAGPCLAQRSVTISSDETAVELEARLADLGVQSVLDAIKTLTTPGEPVGIDQDGLAVTLAPRLKKEDGRVDWSRSAEQIRNQVRALKPWPGTFTDLSDRRRDWLRLILHQVSVVDEPLQPVSPGTMLSLDRNRMVVSTGLGALSLDEVQPAGKRKLSIEEFLRGYSLTSDARFEH